MFVQYFKYNNEQLFRFSDADRIILKGVPEAPTLGNVWNVTSTKLNRSSKNTLKDQETLLPFLVGASPL